MTEVRDKIHKVRSAQRTKEFGEALEIAGGLAGLDELDPYAERELKQQEDGRRSGRPRRTGRSGY